MIHVDDRERIDAWRGVLKGADVEALSGRRHRLALMLFAGLGGRHLPVSEFGRVLAVIGNSRSLQEEILDLMEILGDRIRTVPGPIDPDGVVPLASHATYSMGEIAAAHGRVTEGGKLHFPQTGVLWDQATNTDLLFVTLEKSEKDYSPTTRYADYPISPEMFHWESQNMAAPDTRVGRRHIEHEDQGTKVVLFVRERKKDGRGETLPYHCLGHVRYCSHEGSRPMKIIWRLDRPMPSWLYQAGKTVAA